jgi:hypothetical protein
MNNGWSFSLGFRKDDVDHFEGRRDGLYGLEVVAHDVEIIIIPYNTHYII